MSTEPYDLVDVFNLVGSAIHGKYRIDEVVGEGGFGVVYRGYHLAFDQPVAVKCLKVPGHFTSEARQHFLEKFREEGKHQAKLSQHGSITRVYDYAVTQDASGNAVPYLVLEWLDGKDLHAILEERRATGERFTPIEALKFLRPAIDALAFAHESGIAHRDIKPANLFMANTARGQVLKLLDFGIAKVMQEGDTATQLTTKTNSGFRVFTPAYGAPEQYNTARFGATGPWTDVHAFGLIIVEMVCGRPAIDAQEPADYFAAGTQYERPTPSRLGANVAPGFEALCQRALTQAPTERFGDARALLDAIDDLIADNVDSAAIGSTAPRVTPSLGSAPTELEQVVVAPATPAQATPAQATPAAPPPPNTWGASPAWPRDQVPPPPTAMGASGYAAPHWNAPPPPMLAPMPPPPASSSGCGVAAILISVVAVLGLVVAGAGAAVYWGMSVEPDSKPAPAATPAPVAAAQRCKLGELDACTRDCDRGDLNSCVTLGLMYADGKGVVENDKEAVRLYRKACNGGISAGCNNLGWMWAHGWGTTDKDPREAARLYRKACNGGSNRGCANLADANMRGAGVQKNVNEALRLYRNLCNKGDPAGCNGLGVMYQKGLGVPEDDKEAVRLYRNACDDEFYMACSNLGWMYQSGEGVPKDEGRAVGLHRKACDGGNANGCNNLGWMYQNGMGGLPIDKTKALKLYRKACDTGSRRACVNLKNIKGG